GRSARLRAADHCRSRQSGRAANTQPRVHRSLVYGANHQHRGSSRIRLLGTACSRAIQLLSLRLRTAFRHLPQETLKFDPLDPMKNKKMLQFASVSSVAIVLSPFSTQAAVTSISGTGWDKDLIVEATATPADNTDAARLAAAN